MSTTLRLKGVPSNIFSIFCAEVLGTLILAATVTTATVSHLGLIDGYVSLYTPFVIGAVVMVLFYLLGPVSGCHLNPAVSAGLYAFRKISFVQMATYFLAQFIGAVLGIKLMIELVGVAPSVPTATTQPVNIAECVGAFFILFTVMNVVLGRVKADIAGIVIGAAFTVSLTLTMVTGGGILNPAIAIALGAPVGVTYVIMPILGGLAGAAIAILFDLNKRD